MKPFHDVASRDEVRTGNAQSLPTMTRGSDPALIESSVRNGSVDLICTERQTDKTGGYTRAEAEVVAAILKGIPGGLCDMNMAMTGVRLARAEMTPVGIPSLMPSRVPVKISATGMTNVRPRSLSVPKKCCHEENGTQWRHQSGRAATVNVRLHRGQKCLHDFRWLNHLLRARIEQRGGCCKRS